MNEIVTMNLLPYTSYELMIDTTIPRNLISKVDVETVTLMITEFEMKFRNIMRTKCADMRLNHFLLIDWSLIATSSHIRRGWIYSNYISSFKRCVIKVLKQTSRSAVIIYYSKLFRLITECLLLYISEI